MFLLSNNEGHRKLPFFQALKNLPEPFNLLRWGLKAKAMVWLRKTAQMSEVSKTLQVIPLLRKIVAAFSRCSPVSLCGSPVRELPQVLLQDKDKEKESRLSLQRFLLSLAPQHLLRAVGTGLWDASDLFNFLLNSKLVYVLALSICLWLIVRSYGEKPGKIVSHPSDEVSIVYRVTVKTKG